MASTDQLRQTMEKTFRQYLNAFQEASDRQDPSLLSNTLTPTCLRRVVPVSFLTAMGAPPNYAHTIKGYEDHYREQMPWCKTNRIEITNVSIDTTKKTAAGRLVLYNRFTDGEENVLDMVWFATFTEDGEKITELLQFGDGLEFVKMGPKIMELAKREREEEEKKGE